MSWALLLIPMNRLIFFFFFALKPREGEVELRWWPSVIILQWGPLWESGSHVGGLGVPAAKCPDCREP